MKKILLSISSIAISFSFLGCTIGNSNLQPKTYTTKNITYKDYKFIKVDPVDNEKITTEKIKNYVKTHAYKFGRILKTLGAVYFSATSIRENITADDNYIKGIATIRDKMPFSKDNCKITFTKPYKIIKTDLKVAKQANNITFSKDCYAQTTFGNTYLYMPYQDDKKVKKLINKLPTNIILKEKQVTTNGVFKSPNSEDIINANLERKYDLLNIYDWDGYIDKKTNKNYLKLQIRLNQFFIREKTIEIPKKMINFLLQNNLKLANFINNFRVKKLDNKAKIYIGTYIDPARNGSRVYYIAFYEYPIYSDGKPHGSRKQFNNLIKQFKETVNQ